MLNNHELGLLFYPLLYPYPLYSSNYYYTTIIIIIKNSKLYAKGLKSLFLPNLYIIYAARVYDGIIDRMKIMSLRGLCHSCKGAQGAPKKIKQNEAHIGNPILIPPPTIHIPL